MENVDLSFNNFVKAINGVLDKHHLIKKLKNIP